MIFSAVQSVHTLITQDKEVNCVIISLFLEIEQAVGIFFTAELLFTCL